MSNYILEHASEFERLEKQSQNKYYDYESELSDFLPKIESNILDAGCGSGVVSRFLARKFPHSKFTGCDASDIRVMQAARFAGPIENLNFQREDLTRLSFERATFDHVILRYVAQHQGKEDLKKIFSELNRVLKVGGTIHVVDADGFLFNLFPINSELGAHLEKLKKSENVDFEIGRKIPSMLMSAGFNGVQWGVETCSFSGNDLVQEKQQMKDRFSLATRFFETLFGSSEQAQRFFDSYLESMDQPGAVLFFNKFVVSAVK